MGCGQTKDDYASYRPQTIYNGQPNGVQHALETNYSPRVEVNLRDEVNRSDPNVFNNTFYQQRENAIENVSFRNAVDSWYPSSLEQLIDQIKHLSSNKNAIDKAWIIFYWISQNIDYDDNAYFRKDIPIQGAEDVFRRRKALCEGYAIFYKTIADAIGLQCGRISGYAKIHSFNPRKILKFEDTNHVWNAIQSEKHWYLVDCTQGTGYLEGKKFKQQLNTYYFLCRPEHLIYKQFPLDERWQLLSRPITMKQFLSMPVTWPHFHEYNLEVISPRSSPFAPWSKAGSYSEILIRCPADVQLSGSIRQDGQTYENSELVQYDPDKAVHQCLFAPQQVGAHTITIFAKKITDDVAHLAVRFELDVTDLKGPITFPLAYSTFHQQNCKIYTPLHGILEKHSEVTFHCRIPDAKEVNLTIDSKWLTVQGYEDNVLKRTIKVGTQDVAIWAKYGDNASYVGVLKYTVG